MVCPSIASRISSVDKIKVSKKELKEKKDKAGLKTPSQTTIANSKSKLQTV